MKKIYLVLVLVTLWSCSIANKKKSIDNDIKIVEKEKIEFNSDMISYYNNLKDLMNKNYYWVYNVFNENEFEDSRNDNFKDLALITKNEFEDFIDKNKFENINEFKKFFNQFKAVGKYKNKFDKKHQIELAKIERIIEQITNY
ncbi:hypothetical protein KLA_16100 [Cellulophaga geojensis KL-A]|uniref:Lipoprotein n=1 Tax=Cellulophaga geojensis KL-A TaxID=1328323 RepID=A0ABP3B5P1_9FLAO|nr:hypothetical protein [Cellulophaga geojensis]EWH10947.1 hypothetical protein KLA_16100 [Cellulophaga geojensis KL-A]